MYLQNHPKNRNRWSTIILTWSQRKTKTLNSSNSRKSCLLCYSDKKKPLLLNPWPTICKKSTTNWNTISYDTQRTSRAKWHKLCRWVPADACTICERFKSLNTPNLGTNFSLPPRDVSWISEQTPGTTLLEFLHNDCSKVAQHQLRPQSPNNQANVTLKAVNSLGLRFARFALTRSKNNSNPRSNALSWNFGPAQRWFHCRTCSCISEPHRSKQDRACAQKNRTFSFRREKKPETRSVSCVQSACHLWR